MTYFKDLFHRLGFSWRWILAQFVGILLFLVIGLAWTRLPEKHWWQVALSMLIPVLLAISILGSHDPDLRDKLRAFRAEQTARVLGEKLP